MHVGARRTIIFCMFRLKNHKTLSIYHMCITCIYTYLCIYVHTSVSRNIRNKGFGACQVQNTYVVVMLHNPELTRKLGLTADHHSIHPVSPTCKFPDKGPGSTQFYFQANAGHSPKDVHYLWALISRLHTPVSIPLCIYFMLIATNMPVWAFFMYTCT